MKNWFKVKVRYEKMQDNGSDRMVTETYLIEAVSFTDAEATAVQELSPYMSGEFEISAVGKKRYAECLFDKSGDKYYRIKVNFITIHEGSGIERNQANNILVQANTLKEAINKTEALMDESMIDYSIVSATETAIVEVITQQTESEKI